VSGANFESLAVGPDNYDTDGSGNALHPFLLYACDTTNKIIYRFDPTTLDLIPPQPLVRQQVYSPGNPAITPVCGRSTSTGDFEVSDKANGGVWQLSAIANFPYSGNSIFPTVVSVSASPNTPRGITQKYIGNLLVVDNAGNQVLGSPWGNFSALSTFISNSSTVQVLASPAGIARISTGEVFVSNSVLASGKNAFSPVAHFDRNGSPASTCSVLNFSKKTNQVPAYLATGPVANSTQTAVTDTIYLVTSSNNTGTLWSWNTSSPSCSLSPIANIQNPLYGAAVAPAPITLVLPVTSSTTNPTPTTFNFNSNLFQLTATGCNASVTAYPLIPATINQMIARSGPIPSTGQPSFPDGATPSANLGEGGYEIAYVAKWPGCASVFPSDNAFLTSISGFYDDSQGNNPRILRCDNTSNPDSEPTILSGSGTSCAATQSMGVYPLGGPIPGDLTISSKNSVFVQVNSGVSTATDTTNPPGLFCGFQSPLTGDGTILPSQPAVFDPSVTTTIPVKFKLAYAPPNGNCQNGPYITNAEALLSVARIKDSNDAPVFNAIQINATASSLDEPPLFDSGNQQYQFTLNISGYAAGKYSLTVTFLSDNTTNKTTLFKIQ